MTETIQESPMATNPTKPAKQKKLWIGIVGGIVALLVLVIGFQAYKKHSFKSALRPYALKDNILIEDILALESNGKTTFADYFDKAKKNIEARELLIQEVRMIDAGSYKKELDMYVEILKVENEYIQSGFRMRKTYLELQEAKEKIDRLTGVCNTSWTRICEEWMPTLKTNVEILSKEFDAKIVEGHEEIKKWLSKEKECQETVHSLSPSRNLIPRLEKAVRAQEDKSKGTL